jgi:hypothetical protein
MGGRAQELERYGTVSGLWLPALGYATGRRPPPLRYFSTLLEKAHRNKEREREKGHRERVATRRDRVRMWSVPALVAWSRGIGRESTLSTRYTYLTL